SWWGKTLSAPPVWTSKRSPSNDSDMAEHSICQPGNPSPHGLGQSCCRCSPAAFQSVKSPGCFLRGSGSPRTPVSRLSVVLRDSQAGQRVGPQRPAAIAPAPWPRRVLRPVAAPALPERDVAGVLLAVFGVAGHAGCKVVSRVPRLPAIGDILRGVIMIGAA